MAALKHQQVIVSINCRVHRAPMLANTWPSANLATVSGLSISSLKLSCCSSASAFSVGPGYNRYLVYSGFIKYSR